MNLRMRGAIREPAAAALAMMAAGRFLAAADISTRRVWVADTTDTSATDGERIKDAWAHGTAVVEVSGTQARDAALETARAAGMRAATDFEPAGGDAAYDGPRLAARFAFDLLPDERVVLVAGRQALVGLAERLADFDRALAEDATPRRLVLAGLAEHGPTLAPDLVAAIVHPQVLVELRASDERMLTALAQAADEVIDAP
jgi:hypothetical protein